MWSEHIIAGGFAPENRLFCQQQGLKDVNCAVINLWNCAVCIDVIGVLSYNMYRIAVSFRMEGVDWNTKRKQYQKWYCVSFRMEGVDWNAKTYRIIIPCSLSLSAWKERIEIGTPAVLLQDRWVSLHMEGIETICRQPLSLSSSSLLPYGRTGSKQPSGGRCLF